MSVRTQKPRLVRRGGLASLADRRARAVVSRLQLKHAAVASAGRPVRKDPAVVCDRLGASRN